MTPRSAPAALARSIRAHLRTHGSAEHAAGVQWFFKDAILSHGWYTGDLRKYARAIHKDASYDAAGLVEVAERLWKSRVLEEKVLAVFLVQRVLKKIEGCDIGRFAAWIDGVESWADHDALTMFVLGPLLIEAPTYAKEVVTWATSPLRWRRRAAAVTMIHGVRSGRFVREATRVTHALRRDKDDMVQKGLGWLLREWCKARPEEALPVLLSIKNDTSRLVLRTACETLPAAARKNVLGAGTAARRSALSKVLPRAQR